MECDCDAFHTVHLSVVQFTLAPISILINKTLCTVSVKLHQTYLVDLIPLSDRNVVVRNHVELALKGLVKSDHVHQRQASLLVVMLLYQHLQFLSVEVVQFQGHESSHIHLTD